MFVTKFSLAALLVVSLSLFVVSTGKVRKVIDYEDIPTFPNDYDSVVEPGDETLEAIYEFSKDFIDATVPINFDIGFMGEDFARQDGIEEYAGLLSYVIIMLVIGLLIPLIGIIFCASRCCFNCCGAKAVERHPNQGHVSIIIAGCFTIVFSAFIVFAIAVGMRSNVVMEKGAENIFDKMIVTMKDIIKYSDNTYIQLDHLMITNYDQFSTELTQELDEGIVQIDSSIEDDKLNDMQDGLLNLQASIDKLKGTQSAATSIDSGQTELSEMRTNTIALATACLSHIDPIVQEKCAEIQNIAEIWEIPNFDFPNLNDKIIEMEGIQIPKLQILLDGVKMFGTELKDKLDIVSKQALETTGNAGTEIKLHLNKSKHHIDGVKDWMSNRISDINDAKDIYNDYGKLRYGLTFLLPVILIFIAVFIILGFLTGMLCRIKHYKENGCGNASVASEFFMINTSLIFIFTIVFAVAICGYYAFGLLGQRYICNTFDTMDNVDGLKYLDETLDIEQYFGDGVTFKHLLETCNANKALYEVLRLEKDFKLEDIVDYLDDLHIREAMQELNKKITEEILSLNFPSENPIEIIKELKLDDIQVPLYEDQLAKITELVQLLQALTTANPSINGLSEVLEYYNKYTVYFKELKTNFDDFKTLIKMGGSVTFAKRCDEFIANLNKCIDFITKGELEQLGFELTDGSIYTVENYLNRIKDRMLDTVGLCQPASVAIKATLNEACGNVFNPMNAFWLANFFALIAFIPLLGVFIYLVGYFRQYVTTDDDRYRQAQENNYLYHPPGTRGSTIEAYDVRAHRQPNPPPQQPNIARSAPPPPARLGPPPAVPPKPFHPVQHQQNAVPNHYYNPNSGQMSPQPPMYPGLPSGDNTLTSAAALAEKNAIGAQARSLRRQDEYPYAMKGSSIDTEANSNRRDQYTRF